MKSSKESLSQKVNFDTFFKSVIPIFGQNSDKGLKVEVWRGLGGVVSKTLFSETIIEN